LLSSAHSLPLRSRSLTAPENLVQNLPVLRSQNGELFLARNKSIFYKHLKPIPKRTQFPIHLVFPAPTAMVSNVMQIPTFRHQLQLDGLTAVPLLLPLLQHYRQNLDESFLQKRLQVQFEISYQGNAEAVWLSAPAARQAGHGQLVHHISHHLQRTLRAWLHTLWFSQSRNYLDATRSRIIVAYLACRTWQPRQQGAFGYDLLEEWNESTFERNLNSNLPKVLAAVEDFHRVAGRHECAEFYAPRHSKWFLVEARHHERQFFEYLSRERRWLSTWLSMLGQPLSAGRLTAMREQGAVCFSELFCRGESFPHLSTALEIELLAAISQFAGNDPGRRLVLEARPAPAPLTQSGQNKVIPIRPEGLPRAA
jgi:hypothetical protein